MRGARPPQRDARTALAASGRRDRPRDRARRTQCCRSMRSVACCGRRRQCSKDPVAHQPRCSQGRTVRRVRRAPYPFPCEEAVLWPDNLGLKVGRQHRIVLRASGTATSAAGLSAVQGQHPADRPQRHLTTRPGTYFGEARDGQVPAQERVRQVHVLRLIRTTTFGTPTVRLHSCSAASVHVSRGVTRTWSLTCTL